MDDPKRNIPEHVFISYSTSDKETARKIVVSLQSERVPIWIDYNELTPGTPDWEEAIREAIPQSFAVVVLASPDSRQSRFVRSELSIAQSRDCEIIPVWVRGIDWSDCIPLGMTYTQYIDLRDDKQELGIRNLCQFLKNKIQESIPKHYYVEPFHRINNKGKHGFFNTVDLPPGYVSIELSEEDTLSESDHGSAVFMRLSEYKCLQALLDDLYTNYLSARFAPFTYGSAWVLRRASYGLSIILVSWSWLTSSETTTRKVDYEWLINTPLLECGLEPQSHWELQLCASVQATGLLINDDQIYRAMRQSPKAEYLFRDEGILSDAPLNSIADDFKYQYVISNHSLYSRNVIKPGNVLFQTQKPFSERVLTYLDYI